MLAVAAIPAAAQRGGPRRDIPILIRDVSVIDGTGAAARSHLDIVVRGGKIAAIAPTGTAPAPLPDSVIDARGLFAIPGLIDAHVHMGEGPWESRASTLKGAVQGGVTSVLEVAGDPRATGDLQRAVIVGQIPGPHIQYVALFAGPPFFVDPRVLSSSQGYAPGTAPWMQAVTDTTDFARAVTLAKGTGAVGIKLYASLDSLAIARATAEAHRQGMKVYAHATTFPGLPGDLAAAGVDMLAHAAYMVWQGSPRSNDWLPRARGDFIGVPPSSPPIENLLKLMKARNVALNPTFWVFEREGADSVGALRTPWMQAVARRANQLGIRIVAGTDGLYQPRTDSLPMLHAEMEMMVNGSGLTPLEAITSATQNAAWAAGLDAVTGTIAVGKNADIVLLRADPSADIRNTRAIHTVMQDGRVVLR